MKFPIRKTILVTAPEAMARFKCAADQCEWTCCREWRIPVDSTHGEIYRSMTESDGSKPFAGFLKSIKSSRHGKSETKYFLDLPATATRSCRFLSRNRRCTIQERYGEDGLCDTCLLFPRRLIQFDRETFMTASLACPETIRQLIMTENKLRLTSVSCAADPAVEWIDSDQILNPELRELIRDRNNLFKDWFRLLYDSNIPFSVRIEWLCESIARLDPSDPKIAFERPDYAGIGEMILLIEECFLPQASEFQSSVSDSVSGLFGDETAYRSLVGHAFVQIDRDYLTPFFNSHPRWGENYIAHALYSDAFTEFNAYLRPETCASAAVRFNITRLVLTVNLLLLRLAAAAKKENGLSAASFMRVVYDTDRNFYQSPIIVEAVIERLRHKTDGRPIVWLSDFFINSEK